MFIISVTERTEEDFDVTFVAPDRSAKGELLVFDASEHAADPENHRAEARATHSWEAAAGKFTTTLRVNTGRGVFLVVRQLEPSASAFSPPRAIFELG